MVAISFEISSFELVDFENKNVITCEWVDGGMSREDELIHEFTRHKRNSNAFLKWCLTFRTLDASLMIFKKSIVMEILKMRFWKIIDIQC